jgi:hypothetical protein
MKATAQMHKKSRSLMQPGFYKICQLLATIKNELATLFAQFQPTHFFLFE